MPAALRKSGRRYVCDSSVINITGIKPLNGYWTTLIHFIKCYVGTGIFAMGEGYKYSGLVFGTCFMLIIAIMNLNCQHILIRAAKKIQKDEELDGPVKPTFAETVEYIIEDSPWPWLKRHSAPLGRATNIIVCVCELGFCCVYFVFIAEHLVQIAVNLQLMKENALGNKNIMLAIILLPMWASTFLNNLKLLLPLSIIANILVWVGIIIIYYFTTYDGLPPIEDRRLMGKYETIPFFFGIILYAFEGITFVIPLRNEMDKPQYFTSFFGILNMGMIIIVALYLSVGVLGYWKYGEEVLSSIFLNVAKNHEEIGNAVDAIMALAVLFTFTLHMYIPFEIAFPLFYRRYGPFKNGVLVACVFRTVPVLLTYFIANVIPYLGIFISLVGATAGSFLALIMPALLEIFAFYDSMSCIYVAKDIMIIVLAVVGSITASAVAIWELIQQMKADFG